MNILGLINPLRFNPGGNCPVEDYGTLPTGEYYYFRSRGCQWSLDVSKSEDCWWRNEIIWATGERDYLPWPDAGYIERREAIGLINKAVILYYLWRLRRLFWRKP